MGYAKLREETDRFPLRGGILGGARQQRSHVEGEVFAVAWIEDYETQDGWSYKVVWNVPRHMVPGGKKSHKEAVTVFVHSEALELKRIVESVRGAIRKRDAAEKLEFLLRPKMGLTVADWAAIFLEMKKTEIRTRTITTYTSQLNDVILPALGNRPIAEVTGVDINQFLQQTKKERRISNATCDRYYALLKHMFRVAKDNGKCETNPVLASGWKVGRPDKGKARTEDHAERYFTIGQYEELIAKIRPDYRLFVEFLAETGARFSEVTNLRVGDLSIEKSRAHIQFIEDADGEMELPKSGKKRTIDVPDEIMERVAMQVQGKPADALVFTTARGCMIKNPNFRRDHWNPAMIKLQQCPRHLPERVDGRNGLAVCDPATPSACDCLGDQPWTKYTPHALRHSYATWLLMDGVPVAYVCNQLGHANTRVTETIYAHLEEWWDQNEPARISHSMDRIRGRQPSVLVSV